MTKERKYQLVKSLMHAQLAYLKRLESEGFHVEFDGEGNGYIIDDTLNINQCRVVGTLNIKKTLK